MISIQKNRKLKMGMALLIMSSFLLFSCGNESGENQSHDDHNHDEEIEEKEHALLSLQQFDALGMQIGELPKRNMNSYVGVNGQLEVPPKNEANVSAIVGANVTAILVIEGERVKKGQVLAYLSHPNLIKIQTDYVNSWSQLKYQEEEYKRQEKLYKEKVGSGKEYQRVQADYLTTKAMTSGLEAQLKLMGLSVSKIREGDIYEKVPVFSPIGGYVRMVEVKIGQYVQPQSEMFEVVNIDEVHADFMVFEKDMHLVKEGQRILFTCESTQGKEMVAVIHSVGKSFEQEPKAIHLHAEIENKEGLLIPGMYAKGRIIVDDKESYAIPESAVVKEGDRYYVFTVIEEKKVGVIQYQFNPLEIVVGVQDNEWIEVILLKPLAENAKVALNNAYYLMAEMQKGEAEHSH